MNHSALGVPASPNRTRRRAQVVTVCIELLVATSLIAFAPKVSAAHASPYVELQPAVLKGIRAREAERARISRTRVLAKRGALGIPRAIQLEIADIHTDARGITRTRLTPTLDGVPIRGAGLTAQIDSKGREVETILPSRSLVNIERQTARLSPDEAISKALAHLAPRGPMSHISTPRLVYDPRDAETEGFVLLYEMLLIPTSAADGFHQWVYRVDAQSGNILDRYDSVRRAASKGTGKTIYSGTVILNTSSTSPTTHTLQDLTRGDEERNLFNETLYSPDGRLHFTQGNSDCSADKDREVDLSKLVRYRDRDNAWGDGAIFYSNNTDFTSATAQTSAAEVHFGMQVTWDLFKEVFSLDGPAARGSIAGDRTVAVVNHIEPVEAAAWGNVVVFASAFRLGKDIYTDLETVAHELGHVFFGTSLPCSVYRGESAALDEATADIIGIAAKTFWDWKASLVGIVLPGVKIGDTNNWLIGDAHGKDETRYFHLPSKGVGHSKGKDEWDENINRWDPKENPDPTLDPHRTSGPMRRAFFFLAKGAKTFDNTPGADNEYSVRRIPNGFPGLGLEQALTLWVDVVVYGLAERQHPTFRNFRSGALNVAANRWGKHSPEYKTVEDAFAAVLVGPAAHRTPPTTLWEAKQTRQSLTLVASATDASGVASLSLSLDPVKKGQGQGKTTTVKGDPAQIKMTLPISSIAEGWHTATLRAEDELRNVTEETHFLFVDKSAPTGEVSPRGIQGVLDKWLHCICTDNYGIARVEYFLDQTRGVQGTETLVATVNSAPWTLHLPFTESQQGLWWTYAKVYDAVGWVHVTGERSFYVDNVPPVITSAGLDRAEKEGDHWRLTFHGHVTDNLSILQCDFFVEGLGCAASNPTGRVTEYNFSDTCTSNLPDGTYRGSASCEDFNRNADYKSFPIKLGVPPKACDELVAAGANQPRVFEVDLGQASGTNNFLYKTFTVPDKFIVRCRDGGSYGVVGQFETQCQSTAYSQTLGWLWVVARSNYNCNSSVVEIEVIPNCSGTDDTQWEFEMQCPN